MSRTSIRKRRLSIGACLIAVAVSLSACGGTDKSSESSNAESIQFFLSGDGNQGGGFAKMAAKYKEETGVDVEIVDIAYADLETKLKNAAQANDLPAIARVGSIDPVWRNNLVSLNSITDQSDIMLDFAVVDTNGEVLSIPTDMTAVGMFINKSLFDQAGVAYPTSIEDAWTWDEFVETVNEVREKTGATYGMAMDASSHRLKAFLYEFGSEGFQASESGEFQTNTETGTALKYFKTLHDEGFIPSSIWLADGDGNAMFKSGDVVAYMSGSWQIADFAENIESFEWASTYLPHQPVTSTMYGNAANIVVFDGEGSEAALAFTKWLYEPENYAELASISSFLPAISSITVEYQNNSEAFDIYNEEIAESPAFVAQLVGEGLAYELEGKSTDGDPLREETVKYLNNEQDLDTTISSILELYTSELGPLPQ